MVILINETEKPPPQGGTLSIALATRRAAIDQDVATIRPLQQATLYARLPGYVKSIAVDKGDEVAERDKAWGEDRAS